MPTPHQPPLVVFDLDGTLVDTLPAIAAAMNAVLREHGLPEHPTDRYRRFAGDGAEMLVRRACGSLLPTQPDALHTLIRQFRHHDLKADRDLARPYPGVRDMLDQLHQRGCPLAILSNKEHDEAVDLVHREFGEDRFRAVLGHRPGHPLKPDPTTLLHLIAANHATPASTVYVGDTDTDMRTGRAAGCRTIGCAWGFRDEAELRLTGADHVIHHPAQLPHLLHPAGEPAPH